MVPFSVVVGIYVELAAKVAQLFLFKMYSQFKFNGHSLIIISQVKDTFTQDGIYYRPDLVLCAPDGIPIGRIIHFHHWLSQYHYTGQEPPSAFHAYTSRHFGDR